MQWKTKSGHWHWAGRITGLHQAAQQAAMMYSFFDTCKLNGVDLTDTLRKLPDAKINELDHLLPLNKQSLT